MAELLPEAPIAEADGDTNFAENPYKARTHREEEGGDRERKESRKDRDRSDRDRGDRHRSDRDRDRDRDRKDRHKDRTRERDRDRSPKDKERRRRKSRSRSPKEPRRKRVSGFDQPPAAPLGFAAMPGVTPQQAALASLASAAGIDIGTVAPQAMTQQATRHARRVYVGGLPPGANEQTVAKFFSQAIAAVGGTNSGGDSVVNVYINQEKKFAFVEFRTVEETSNAMALDGIMFEGASVRVRRPNDYNPAMAATLGPSTPNPNLNLAVIGLSQPGAVADGPDRIFVGGLPYYLTEEQCSELLGKFGAVRAFELVRDRETGNSKGYGFAVFEDPSVVDMACAGLNGVPMGDKTLTVRRATAAGQAKPDTDSVIAQAQQQIAMSMIGGGLPPANLNLPGMQLPGHNAAMPNMMPQMPGMLSSPPTRVVSLVDVVNVEELSDEVTYQEIKEDMQDECARYGTIASLEIPRPSSDGSYVGGFGKVFVQYENLEGSLKARNALNGRKFDGKVVKAEFYDESRFSAGDFS